MSQKILSACVSAEKEAPAVELQFHPGINILWRQNAEHVVLSLASSPLFAFGGDGQSIVDGSRLPDVFFGANDLLLKNLRKALAKEDDRPLFIFNYLERLDEAVELHPIFNALKSIGRQVFIAVPHYYKINTWEELYHDTAIHIL